MGKTDETIKRGNAVNTIFVMAASLFCTVIGIFLLFVPQIGEAVICYICCVAMIVWGILQISKYFVTESYKRLHDYSFAIGTMLVVLGCCGLVRAQDILDHQEVYIGLAILAIGIVLLQCAVQLKMVNSNVWIAETAVSLVIIICSIFVLVNFTFFVEHFPNFPEWVLMLSGICSLISFPLVAVMIRKDKTRPTQEDMDQADFEEALLDDDSYEEMKQQNHQNSDEDISYDDSESINNNSVTEDSTDDNVVYEEWVDEDK